MVAGVGAGEDRRVVGQRDRRQRRHGPVAEAGAHGQQPGHVGRLARGRPCRRARWRWCRPTGTRRRGRARSRRSSSSVSARRPGGPAGRRAGGAPSGPTPPARARRPAGPAPSAPRRPAGRTGARARPGRTPAPARTNGARACTTPSDPCSPRSPPWSSQLWAGGVQAHEVGRGGVVEQLGDLLVGVRVGAAAVRSGQRWPARRPAAGTGRWRCRPAGCGPRRRSTSKRQPLAPRPLPRGGTAPARRPSAPRSRRRRR